MRKRRVSLHLGKMYMKELPNTVKLNTQGEDSLRYEFKHLSRWSKGVLNKSLNKLILSKNFNCATTCLPNGLTQEKIDEYYKNEIDYEWELYKFAPVINKDVKMLKSSEEWLSNEVTNYLRSGKNRLCVVLETWLPDIVEEWYYPDFRKLYRWGNDERYIVFSKSRFFKSRFNALLFTSIVMSYGCLISLPDDFVLEEIRLGKEIYYSNETVKVFIKYTDAVYVGAHDGLGYMIGWLTENR